MQQFQRFYSIRYAHTFFRVGARWNILCESNLQIRFPFFKAYVSNIVAFDFQWPLLLTWFNFNFSMDK